MNWKDVAPGVYSARITDYGLEEVAKLNNAIKVVIMLDVSVYQETSVQVLSGKWDGFIATKDGRPNEKTMKTLAVCGMKSDELMDLALKPDMLDRSLDLEVQIIADGDYKRIDWINRVGGMASIKKSVPKTRPSIAFKAALAAARASSGPATEPDVPRWDDDSELPF